jgi:hypothetical protein
MVTNSHSKEVDVGQPLDGDGAAEDVAEDDQEQRALDGGQDQQLGVRTNLRTVRCATATALGQNLAPALPRACTGSGAER